MFLLNRVIFPGPGEIVAPVPDIEHRKHEGEEHSGEHINLLGLELKVLEPQEKFVRLSARQTMVNDSSRWDDVRSLHSPHQRVLVLGKTSLKIFKKSRGFSRPCLPPAPPP